jgi:hypothetical protein
MRRALSSSEDALSRDSAINSWFCRLARRCSASNQCDNIAMVTGTSIARQMSTQSRRVSPLRSTELYGDPLI